MGMSGTHDESVCRVAFLDIGQGDAIFVESPTGRQMLIDGGANQSVLRQLPTVMGAYDRTIDVVVATHPDQDHIGGLSYVFDRYEVGAIVATESKSPSAAYGALTEGALSENAARVTARRGMLIDLGASTTFRVLYPDRDVMHEETNDASIVGQLTCNGQTYMLTGDAPQWVERYLVGTEGTRLKSDVLKAGHHGSNTSSAREFVKLVDPDVAIISAGKDNRYGHPHPEVIELFKAEAIAVRSTADEGTIIFATVPSSH